MRRDAADTNSKEDGMDVDVPAVQAATSIRRSMVGRATRRTLDTCVVRRDHASARPGGGHDVLPAVMAGMARTALTGRR